jgi:mannose-6-phosphate isomerase-like protein (cupin superfamily)
MTASSTSSAPSLRLENVHTGEILELRRRRRGNETWLELSGSLPPRREGPPMHIHYAEDEVGEVTAGTLTAHVGGKQIEIGTGGTARLPMGIAHRWWNGGDQPLVFNGTARPLVDLDRYLQAVFEVLNAGTPGRPPLFYIAHVALRHRQTQHVIVMPAPLQAVIFRAVVAIGTVLGKYRGTDWPGCPARCGGAPEVSDAEA